MYLQLPVGAKSFPSQSVSSDQQDFLLKFSCELERLNTGRATHPSPPFSRQLANHELAQLEADALTYQNFSVHIIVVGRTM
jgi:hypothetical protein